MKFYYAALGLMLGLCGTVLAQDKAYIKARQQFYDTTQLSSVKVPYVQKFVYGNKTVVLYGTDHAYNDPNSELFTRMEAVLDSLKPEVMLTENFGVIGSTKELTISKYNDVGYCSFYGATHEIPVHSWDLDLNGSYHILRKKYTQDEVFLTLLSNLDYKYTSRLWSDYESFYKVKLGTFEMLGYPLRGQQKSLDYYFKLFEKHFKKPFVTDISAAYSQQLSMIDQDKKLKEIRFYSYAYRDFSLLKALSEQLEKHDKVFLQAGALHIYAIQAFLPELMKEVSKNQIKKNQSAPVQDDGLEGYSLYSGALADTNLLWINSKVNNTRILVTNKKISPTVSRQIYPKFQPAIFLFEDRQEQQNALKEEAIALDQPSLCWSPTWDILYHELLKKGYSHSDIFHYTMEQCLAAQYPELADGGFNDANFPEAYRKVFENLSALGFPFKPEEVHFYAFVGQSGFGERIAFSIDLNRIKTTFMFKKIANLAEEGMTKPESRILLTVNDEIFKSLQSSIH